MIRTVLAFSLAAAAAHAHPAITVFETMMRDAPTGHARPVQHVPARAEINLGPCGGRWRQATWRDLEGYIRIEAVAPGESGLQSPLGLAEEGFGPSPAPAPGEPCSCSGTWKSRPIGSITTAT